MRRPTAPSSRTILHPRDPVGELVLVMAIAALALASVVGLAAAILAVSSHP